MFNHLLRNNRGSALIELALTVPLMFILIIGSAELARIAYASIEVENAARAATAYACQNVVTAFGSSTGSPIAAIKAAAQNEAPNLTITFPEAPTQACVCETVTNGVATYVPYNGSTSIPAPISCYSSGTTLNSDFTSCDATGGNTSQQVVEYVIVETQATVHTMFQYNVKHFGLPSDYTLTGYSQMRVLQN